jgi:TonB-linked SusC/RagA family outer membrane protein
MKKKLMRVWRRNPFAQKILLTMRLTLFLMVLGVFSAYSASYAQKTKLNLNAKNIQVKDVLNEIENQSEFFFMYDNKQVDVERKVDLEVNSMNIDQVLQKLFEGTATSFKVVNRQILLFPENQGFSFSQQNGKVTGKVTDSSGNALPGVSVVVKGTTNGTITDINGSYSVSNVSENSTLQFSFVGMKAQEVAVGGKSVINVSLVDDAIGIEEVVAIGYGTSRKSDISGSVVSVNREEMMKKNPTNILQGLQGQAAGVIVSAQDGAPDANAAIRIRGVATINGIADPLYVIDGVQLRTSTIVDGKQVALNANFVNPNDIESIEILKDASATAIYGSAGANGVIMITTKKGKAGATHITFSADYGVQTLSSTLDVGDVDQYAANIRQARINDGGILANQIFASKYDGQRNNIDWQKEMTRTSLKQQYNLSASGGTEKTQSNFSLGYLNNDGIVINSNYKRLTARANIVSKVTDFIEIGSDLNFSHIESHGSNAALGNNGNLSSQRDWAITAPTMDYVDPVANKVVSPKVKNPDGTYGAPEQGDVGSNDSNLGNNIYAEQMENTGMTKNNQVLLSAYANIKLFKGLTFKSIASYNFTAGNWYNFWGNKKRYFPDGTQVKLYNYDTKYYLGINNSNYNNLAIENYLTYNWKNDIHNLTLMAGNSVSKGFGNWSNASGNDFPGDNIRDISLTKDPTARTGLGAYNLQSRGLSYFGRIQYSLMDRYIVTGTMRRDGSSNFGADNRWGNFPSVAAAWRISEENFMKTVPAISNLKLRLGWGQTGNSGGPTDLSVTALTTNKIQYFYYGQNGQSGMNTTRQLATGYAPTLTDPRLKWETNEQSNIGLDLGLLDNNLNVTMDYFIRKSKDLLLYQSIRPSSGYTQVYTNYGEIENKGIEFSVNYKKQINQDWNFSATLTGSTLKNKVIKMGADLFSENTSTTNDGSNVGAVGAPSGTHWNGHSICREGYAVGSFYGYQVEGIYQTQAEIDAANAAAIAAGHPGGYNNGSTTVPGDFKFKDISGPNGVPDGFLDANDMTILGNGFPKLNYGLTLNTTYKNWDFSIYAYGVAGAEIYSYSAMTLSNMFPSDNGTTPNVLTEVAQDAWTSTKHSTTTPRLSFLDLNYNMRGSDEWVKKGDFLKISNVQVGYNFDRNMLKTFHMESARLYVSVQNLACFSSYNKYGDPEAGQGSVLYTGLDTGRYPMPRTYSIGLNIQF